MSIFLLILLIITMVMVVSTQTKVIKNSSEKSQKIISQLSILCLGFGIGVLGYIIFSGIIL